MHKSILLTAICLLLSIDICSQTITIDLENRSGAYPIRNRLIMSNDRASNKIPEGIPEYLISYKIFETPFLSDELTDQKQDSLLSLSGFGENDEKYVIIDANFNGDLSDDKVFVMEYDEDEYLDYAQNGRTPEKYIVDTLTWMDRVPNNELKISKRIILDGSVVSMEHNVEITPNFIVFPNPAIRTLLADEYFPFTYSMLDIDHRYGEVEIDDQLYQLAFQPYFITRSYKDGDTQMKIINAPNEDQNHSPYKVYSVPQDLLIVNDQAFEVSLNTLGTQAYLKKSPLPIELPKPKAKQYSSFKGKTIYIDQPQTFKVDTGMVLLHFWGTWCGACKVGYPQLVEIANQYESLDLRILGVAAEYDIDREYLLSVKEKSGMSWPHLTYNLSDKLGLPSLLDVFIYPTYILFQDGLEFFRTNDINALDKEIELMSSKK